MTHTSTRDNFVRSWINTGVCPSCHQRPVAEAHGGTQCRCGFTVSADEASQHKAAIQDAARAAH